MRAEGAGGGGRGQGGGRREEEEGEDEEENGKDEEGNGQQHEQEPELEHEPVQHVLLTLGLCKRRRGALPLPVHHVQKVPAGTRCSICKIRGGSSSTISAGGIWATSTRHTRQAIRRFGLSSWTSPSTPRSTSFASHTCAALQLPRRSVCQYPTVYPNYACIRIG